MISDLIRSVGLHVLDFNEDGELYAEGARQSISVLGSALTFANAKHNIHRNATHADVEGAENSKHRAETK